MFDGCWPGSRLATFICITCVSHRSCGISAGMVPHFYMIRMLVVLSALMALLTFLATCCLCIFEGIYFCSGTSYEINCINLVVEWFPAGLCTVFHLQHLVRGKLVRLCVGIHVCVYPASSAAAARGC